MDSESVFAYNVMVLLFVSVFFVGENMYCLPEYVYVVSMISM